MLFSNLAKQPNSVLIIDDSAQNILFLQEVLSDIATIYFATNGHDGLALSEQLQPSLILLDIEMPQLDGWQVCRQLKDNAKTRDIPVIFVTSHDGADIELQAFETGAIDFITKPFNSAICRLRVQNQLQLCTQAKLIKQTQEELNHLVKQVPVLITYWDTHWHQVFSNDQTDQWFKHQGVVGKNLHITTYFPDELVDSILVRAEGDECIDGQYIIELYEQDEPRFLNVFLSTMMQNGHCIGYLVTCIDISEAKLAKKALHSEKERLRVTLNSIGDAVIACDTEGQITFMNPIAERMTGWRFRDAQNQKIETVMRLRDAMNKSEMRNPLYLALQEQRVVAMALNCELVSLNGQVFSVEDSAAPIRDESGEIIGAIMVFHDVSEAMAMALKMSHLANHDQLTDLPNRILLQDRLSVALSSARSEHHKVAVILIDIDHFKYLNDTLGHQQGDELICLMAKRIKRILPDVLTIARLGGDEFVVVMDDIQSLDYVANQALNLVASMHEPFQLAREHYSVSASLGVSIFPDDATDEEQLIRHADVAMYRAKQEGRNRFCFFSDELEQRLLQRHALEIQLREAIKQNSCVVLYQPKFNLLTKEIVGAEALVRLLGTNGELISPAEFIPLAEESGLIIPLGRQVLFKACEEASKWHSLGVHIQVSVNVAAQQFSDPDLEHHIKSALLASKLPACYLELEITETALMGDVVTTQIVLEKLKALGVRVSIDDFGTGYSSLAYLKKFTVDVMKIDMSFVKDMLVNQHDHEIVKTIITLGQSMNLVLVAEGVETEAQLTALAELGCEVGQGYVFSKPVADDAFMALLTIPK